MNSKLPKVIALIGPTASGKTEWGIVLAKKFEGEVVNFDSRQVYKEMNIGTAKPKGAWTEYGWGSAYEVEGVPHHLMDYVEPDKEYTLADFKKDAVVAIQNILKRGKLPILVGGTGLYFWGVLENLDMAETGPNTKLRKELENKSLDEMVELLRENDPQGAQALDLKNPRRVIRALEVVLSTGLSFVKLKRKGEQLYTALKIGIKWDKEELNERINKRVDKQVEEGLPQEAAGLAKKYGWNLPSMTSIGYRQMAYYLNGEASLGSAIEILKKDTRRYAKRQITWFKRDSAIMWVRHEDFDKVTALVEKFIR